MALFPFLYEKEERRCDHSVCGYHSNFLDERPFSVKQRGREKKGPPDIAPKSFSQKVPKWCSVLSIGVIGKSHSKSATF